MKGHASFHVRSDEGLVRVDVGGERLVVGGAIIVGGGIVLEGRKVSLHSFAMRPRVERCWSPAFMRTMNPFFLRPINDRAATDLGTLQAKAAISAEKMIGSSVPYCFAIASNSPIRTRSPNDSLRYAGAIHNSSGIDQADLILAALISAPPREE
jgi:hypothetical protein